MTTTLHQSSMDSKHEVWWFQPNVCYDVAYIRKAVFSVLEVVPIVLRKLSSVFMIFPCKWCSVSTVHRCSQPNDVFGVLNDVSCVLNKVPKILNDVPIVLNCVPSVPNDILYVLPYAPNFCWNFLTSINDVFNVLMPLILVAMFSLP